MPGPQFQSSSKTKTAGAALETVSFPVPAGKNIVIKAIDFSAPAGNGSVLSVDVSGNYVAAAQSDKFIKLPESSPTIPSGSTVNLRFDNSGGTNDAKLGISVWYEIA